MGKSTLPRGTVTFLFTDIEQSTELVRRLGNEAFAAARAEHRRLLRDIFAAHDGVEIDTAGDGFFIAFDSAREAVTAAIEGQRKLSEATWPNDADVRIRMGLHTAEPHLTDDGYVGVGVHRAARVCDAGHGGQILLSNATAGIVEDAEVPGTELVDLGEHRLKDLPSPQRLFQLSAPGLQTTFPPPRTREASTRKPGIGTFVLSDLSGHRHLIRDLGDEASSDLIDVYRRTVRSIVDEHHGTILELVGDNVLAVFDSASDALRGAHAIRHAISRLEWPDGDDRSVSIVVHSGRWSGDPERTNAGTALYRLGALDQHAAEGQILVSGTTAALVEGDKNVPPLRAVGPHTLDESEPMLVYEL